MASKLNWMDRLKLFLYRKGILRGIRTYGECDGTCEFCRARRNLKPGPKATA